MSIIFQFEFSTGGVVIPKTKMAVLDQVVYKYSTTSETIITAIEFTTYGFTCYYLLTQVRLAATSLRKTGSLAEYDDVFDRCTTRNEKALRRIENREFYYVTTTDDPVIEKLAPCGMRSKAITPECLALPRNSHRKKCPS